MHTRSELASSSKRSGGLFLATNTKKGKLNPKKRFGRAERSIWNSKDDWETLVADSALSTSSVSTRPPRPRGLHSLVKCASDAAARNFKRLWNDGVVMADGAVVYGAGKRWKIAWERIPEHLKAGLRDGIFKWWGSYVTPMMLQDVPSSLFALLAGLTLNRYSSFHLRCISRATCCRTYQRLRGSSHSSLMRVSYRLSRLSS